MHQCSECLKLFTRSANLRNHILTVHDKLKPYECDVCSKKLSSLSSLIRHKRILHQLHSIGNGAIESIIN
ncbi:MAG: hypothetical protein E6K54_08790 [Gammaproteobacteria bacterium]|nr:MAG: hypothetical protein E6K54_08790 [Gammaproteobacteria bacterium]